MKPSDQSKSDVKSVKKETAIKSMKNKMSKNDSKSDIPVVAVGVAASGKRSDNSKVTSARQNKNDTSVISHKSAMTNKTAK